MTEDQRSNRASRRNLKQALATLDQMSEELSIPSDTVSTATQVYRQFLQRTSEDRMYGWGIEEAAVACLYIGCKVDRVPRNAEEFVEVSDVSEKGLLRRSKEIRSELDLDLDGFVDPTGFVERYCDELELDGDFQWRAKKMLEYAEDAGITGGKSPQGQAAAAIYNTARERGEKITQNEIAKVADVTNVTIRNRYQELADIVREYENPPDDPKEAVDWLGELIEIDTAVVEEAHLILSHAHKADVKLDSGRQWGAAAIRLASENAGNPVSKYTLKTVTGLHSQDIQAARNRLKDLKS